MAGISLVLGVGIDGPGLALAIAACGFSCTGLGICFGALGLRGRNVLVLANLVDGIILVLCGVNVPLDRLPDWAQTIASGFPLTHGIEAARRVADGSSLSSAGHLLLVETAIGAVYFVVGVVLLRVFEFESRRTASLETF